MKQKLDTIWEVPDELWARIEPILLEDAPPKRTGRKRASWRRALDGILFRMRSTTPLNSHGREQRFLAVGAMLRSGGRE